MKIIQGARAVFYGTFNELKMVYQKEKMDIENELKKIPNIFGVKGIYVKAFSMLSAIVKLPEVLIKNLLGGFKGSVVSFLFSIFNPYRSVIRMFDVRFFIGVIKTIFLLVINCVPRFFRVIIDVIMAFLAKIYDAVTGLMSKSKKLVQQRKFLLEQEYQEQKKGIINWAKRIFGSILGKAKSVASFLLKIGKNAFIKILEKILLPIAECVSESNRLQNMSQIPFTEKAINQLKNIANMLGLTSLVSAIEAGKEVGALLMTIPLVGGFIAYFSYISMAFLVASAVMWIGNLIIFVDAFSELSENPQGLGTAKVEITKEKIPAAQKEENKKEETKNRSTKP